MLSGLEIDGVSQIFTLFKNVADGHKDLSDYQPEDSSDSSNKLSGKEK